SIVIFIGKLSNKEISSQVPETINRIRRKPYRTYHRTHFLGPKTRSAVATKLRANDFAIFYPIESDPNLEIPLEIPLTMGYRSSEGIVSHNNIISDTTDILSSQFGDIGSPEETSHVMDIRQSCSKQIMPALPLPQMSCKRKSCSTSPPAVNHDRYSNYRPQIGIQAIGPGSLHEFPLRFEFGRWSVVFGNKQMPEFQTIASLIDYYRTYSYINAQTGEVEILPVWNTNAGDSSDDSFGSF
ncbi:unnamed protein product, partial [Toxocara canis]|uniref:PAP_RNA-bind domain-containing protein n=1 Tax=Toxocara canis TaxID=6265 RepID=A0A183UY49_TOXCA